MAITIANVLSGNVDSFSATIIASADADTTATIPHGLSFTPLVFMGVQVLSQALAAMSAWAITTVDGTNIVCTKLATAGSGNAGIQYRVYAARPHSIGK